MKRLLVVSALVAGVSTAMSAQGFFRGGPEAEMQVVGRFDADKNGRLDTAERAAARKWLGGGNAFSRRRPGLSGAGGTALQLTPEQVPSFGQAALYDTATLRTIFLTFDNPDWASELAAFYNTDVDVPATVTVDGQVYKEVGVHFRGASSYRMVGDEAKKSLNLAFNHAIGTQRLRGYRTLNLLNGNGDPSFVRTRLYSEIAGKYIPTPKTNYVRVVVNGESWGVYINSQQFNADFTREFYGSTRGARWKVPGTPRGRGGMEYLGADARQAGGGTGARPRHRWRPEVPRARSRAGQLRRLLDAGERLQHLPGRTRQVPRHPARRQRVDVRRRRWIRVLRERWRVARSAGRDRRSW
jgi:hypothetical protein